MSLKRDLSQNDKEVVKTQQVEPDGSLRCFVSGDIIIDGDEIEYDHILPYSKDGPTEIANIRIVLKKYNRQKTNKSIYEARDNIKLERLFEAKRNQIRLQDIFDLKDVQRRNIHTNIGDQKISLTDSVQTLTFPLFDDAILNVRYFYGRIPVSWLENDDQEGLQPRVIDYKRLISIRDHLKSHPQLAPSIGRLLNGQLKLFDGQHKLAAQTLNNNAVVDIKIYISPDGDGPSKGLFDSMMITNLEAHSKLKQVPFYTSTLLDRLSVIYSELLNDFFLNEEPEAHTEQNFIRFLVSKKSFSAAEAKNILRSAIKNAALDSSSFRTYVAEASKDASFPITVDLLEKTIFRSTLFQEASSARFTSQSDYRNSETSNFASISKIIVEQTGIENWTTHSKGKNLSNLQLKSRRIWHKGAVLTWAPYLKSILFFALQCMTNDQREKKCFIGLKSPSNKN